MLLADSSDLPPASPSSAGAERSRHFCPLSLSFSLSSSVRQGSSAAGPTRPLPAAAAVGRCKAAQPFPCRLPPPLSPPLQ